MANISRITESFSATVRCLGWGNGLTYILSQGLLRLSRGYVRIIKYHLVVQPLRNGLGIPMRRGRDIEIREIGPGDQLLGAMGHPPATIANRLRQGSRCLAALKEGELAGFLWWVEGAYEEDEVRCLFVPEPEGLAVWDFDVYVSPHKRAGPVFARLWDAASRCLVAAGYRYTCSRISAFNPASLAAHERLGARVVAKRLFICLGRLQVMVGGRRRPLHVSISDSSRPRVRVALPGSLLSDRLA